MTDQNSKNKYLPLLLLLLIVFLGLGYFFFMREPSQTEELVQKEEKIEDTTTALKQEIVEQAIDTVKKIEEKAEEEVKEKVEEIKKVAKTEVKKEEQKTVQKKEVKKEEADEIIIADSEPQPVGGYAAFYQYVRKNLHYPEAAKEKDIQGQVQVRFQVLRDRRAHV